MSKCSKVKNPCKICLGPVVPKNGLQCKGACKTWIHFECVNYTPGKIKDIKAGIIKVTCPCPDCKTTEPKEYLTKQPYSCTNIHGPADRQAKRENKECSPNKGPDKINQTSITLFHPLHKCGIECKEHSVQKLVCNASVPTSMTKPPCTATEGSVELATNTIEQTSGDTVKKHSRSDLSSLGTLQQMCRTVGQLANQINHLMNKMKQAANKQDGTIKTEKMICPCPSTKAECPKPCHCPLNPNRKN